MEYLVMECGLSYAVVMDQDGRILKVPNLGYTVGQTLEDVVLLPERPAKATIHKRIARWGTMVACLCLLLLGSWVWQSPIGTVRMQINPDVQLSVNRFDRVVALEGLNEDGTSLIDGYRAYGKGMKTVSDELADRAMELGYLSDGGQITLTVDSEKDGWKTAAEELLLLELDVHFEHRVTVTVDGRRRLPNKSPREEVIIPSSRTKISSKTIRTRILTMIRRKAQRLALMKMTMMTVSERMAMRAMISKMLLVLWETRTIGMSRRIRIPVPKAAILTMMTRMAATMTRIRSSPTIGRMMANPMMKMRTIKNIRKKFRPTPIFKIPLRSLYPSGK